MGSFPTKIVEVDKVKEKADKKGKPAAKAGGQERRAASTSTSRFPAWAAG